TASRSDEREMTAESATDKTSTSESNVPAALAATRAAIERRLMLARTAAISSPPVVKATLATVRAVVVPVSLPCTPKAMPTAVANWNCAADVVMVVAYRLLARGRLGETGRGLAPAPMCPVLQNGRNSTAAKRPEAGQGRPYCHRASAAPSARLPAS